ncbi:hypothetical protein MGSAQ_003233, partial [marine sediment metagenome]
QGLATIAALMGEGDVQAWCARLKSRLERVHALTERFFAPYRSDRKACPTCRTNRGR